MRASAALRGSGILPVSAFSASPARGPEMRTTAIAAGPRPEERAKMVGRSVDIHGWFSASPAPAAPVLRGKCRGPSRPPPWYRSDAPQHRASRAPPVRGCRQRAFAANIWIDAEKLNRFADARADFPRSIGVSVGNIFGNSVEMPSSAPRIAQSHRPNFFQLSVISASVANSPRSASAIASFTSASCSAVRRYCDSLFAKTQAAIRQPCPGGRRAGCVWPLCLFPIASSWLHYIRFQRAFHDE